MTYYFDRRRRELVMEHAYQADLLARLYSPGIASFLLPIIKSRLFSKLWTWKDYLPSSRKKIQHFIQKYQLQPEEFTEQDFAHFAAFFERSYLPSSRPRCLEPEIMAVTDGKLLVYPLESQMTIEVKGRTYALAELFPQQTDWSLYHGGYLFLYRLAMEDNHHYLFAESGPMSDQSDIPGSLHTIRDLGHRHSPVFIENQRSVCKIHQSKLGPIWQMEIGALTVGRIINHPRDLAQRGQEKGYFKLGGSSIIVLYPASSLKIDADILEWSQQGIETQVRMGERIGIIDD
ncbi:phosphatidylserine decarboxylase [Ignavigranum ruoffiae]|uniref:Phosphatidylserine decarboxylase n=1 Tax=Ignavigranum ruoffiae TaxID=89093 RepID=A0A1H9DD73_9LACT|nr:phosphatidylserine decarboxylase [Ignavigranum ruoffiae]SEQ11512.1 phosphatidylserine decarboxylase [Ignavigranum ruoffiae]